MADIKIAVVPFSFPGDLVSFDVVAAELDGATPKAVLLFGGAHNPAYDASTTTDGNIELGAADGTRQTSVSAHLSNNNTSTLAGGVNVRNTMCLGISTLGTTEVIQIAFTSWLAGGARFTCVRDNRITKSAVRLCAVFFAGEDLEAYVGTTAIASGTVNITAPGFEPDVVITACGGLTSYGGDYYPRISYGVAVNTGTEVKQRAVSFHGPVSTPSSNPARMASRSDACIIRINTTDGSYTYATSATDFDADGFSLVTPSGAIAHIVTYLALKFGGHAVDLVDFLTPTATGNVEVYDGFDVLAELMFSSIRTAYTNSGTVPGAEVGLGIGAGAKNSDEAATAMHSSNLTSPTVTRNKTLADKEAMLYVGNTLIASGEIASRTDGLTLNFTTVDATARQVFGFVVEDKITLVPYNSGTRRSVNVM